MDYDNLNCINQVLLNTFTIKNFRYKVYFHRGTLIWETERTPYSRYSININDIIAVEPVHKTSRNDRVCCTSKLEISSFNHDAFTIMYSEKYTKNRLRLRRLTFKHQDGRQIACWLKTLKNFILNETFRPKRLLVFINPFGGKGQGEKIYKYQVSPLFSLVGIRTDVFITQAPSEAKEKIEKITLSDYDGIICVGGDGTFSEVLNGLILKTAKDINFDLNIDDLPRTPMLRLGVIPAGSTDTIAFCLYGTNDVETSVLNIILGGERGMDVCSVRQHDTGNFISYTASLISYGYLGDVIKDSEHFRWMGPRRYDYSGFKKFISNKGYEGEVRIKVCPEKPCSAGCANEGPKCENGCKVCNRICENTENETGEWKIIEGRFFMVNGANLSCACPRSPNGIAPFCHVGNGCVDIVLVKHTSFFNNLKLLFHLGSNTRSLYDLPFVEVHRAHAFSFIPKTSSNRRDISVWNGDGDLIRYPDLDIRVHKQLVNVFSKPLSH